jgi:putative addiction module component (TIGR02574 family)
MNARVTQFIEQAKLSLSASERFALAEAMLESVQVPVEPGIEQAWAAEIDSRMNQVESGGAEYFTSEQVYAEVKKLLK